MIFDRVGFKIAATACLVFATSVLSNSMGTTSALAASSAKKLFGAQKLPSDAPAQSYGFYSKGCMDGAAAMPVDGPRWQVMRLSRNRRFGQPRMISILEKLSEKAYQFGWNGLLVGDISQPRGGPMLTGHASHQIGLDADIWFTPMPDKRLTYEEREKISAVSLLKKNSHYVDNRRWNSSYEKLLKTAAGFDDVERIFVHPGIKKKLCETVKGDRAWLNKVRPFYGHNYHFHIRIACQPGSPNCRKQKSTGTGTGCGNTLNWWFKSGLGSPKPRRTPKKKVVRRKKREKTLAHLPKSCRAVLKRPGKDLKSATLMAVNTPFSAPPIKIPEVSVASILRSKPLEASKTKNPVFLDNIVTSSRRTSPATPNAGTNAASVATTAAIGNSAIPAKSPLTSAYGASSDSVSLADRVAESHMPLSRIPVPEPRPGK